MTQRIVASAHPFPRPPTLSETATLIRPQQCRPLTFDAICDVGGLPRSGIDSLALLDALRERGFSVSKDMTPEFLLLSNSHFDDVITCLASSVPLNSFHRIANFVCDARKRRGQIALPFFEIERDHSLREFVEYVIFGTINGLVSADHWAILEKWSGELSWRIGVPPETSVRVAFNLNPDVGDCAYFNNLEKRRHRQIHEDIIRRFFRDLPLLCRVRFEGLWTHYFITRILARPGWVFRTYIFKSSLLF